MAFLHEGAPCGMSSLRSDTLTMRVTGVRITVFCSAIVIDVIVHCHTAGALLSQTAENNCPYHRVVGFLILSGQFIITRIASVEQIELGQHHGAVQSRVRCSCGQDNGTYLEVCHYVKRTDGT